MESVATHVSGNTQREVVERLTSVKPTLSPPAVGIRLWKIVNECINVCTRVARSVETTRSRPLLPLRLAVLYLTGAACVAPVRTE